MYGTDGLKNLIEIENGEPWPVGLDTRLFQFYHSEEPDDHHSVSTCEVADTAVTVLSKDLEIGQGVWIEYVLICDNNYTSAPVKVISLKIKPRSGNQLKYVVLDVFEWKSNQSHPSDKLYSVSTLEFQDMPEEGIEYKTKITTGGSSYNVCLAINIVYYRVA